MMAQPLIVGHGLWTLWSGCGAWASGNYEAAFRENEIDETVLASLTDETLKELGVTALGHRRKLLDPNGKQIGTKPRQ